MRPDSRSVSFTFHREILSVRNSPEMTRSTKNLRQRLQDRFDKDKPNVDDPLDRPTKVKTSTDRGWNNLNLGNVSADSRKALRSGAEKLCRTIFSVRTTFGTISQKFRSSTRRRQRLEEQQSPNSTYKSQTPQTRSRILLGRTPTKLYSPFGIESPSHGWDKENESVQMHKTNQSSRSYVSCRPSCLKRAKGFSVLR